jgi:hypothetical protein
MRFDLRRAGACLALPLLGSALAVGAAALPASAQTWQDTALQAFSLAQPTTIYGAGITGVVGNSGSTLTFTAPSGVEIATGAAPLTSGPGFDATLTTNTTSQLVLTTTGAGPGMATLMFTIKSADSAIACTANETVSISEASGVLSEATPTSVPGETVTVSVSNDSATGAVQFSATTNVAGCTVPTFSESNLPAGLTSGNPLVPGTASPGVYNGLSYTATDQLGSTFSGAFDLDVFGHLVTPPPPPTGNYGDEVNPFGNGFDAYQQHQYPGAIIAGWPATQADPATHFISHAGAISGAYQFEYAPYGAGTGLCVSDPGGGWSSDPLPDGLILTPCNTGPWQQFIPQSDGTLQDVATGLYVNPDGTGAQLAGGTAPTPWGGSVYTWTGYAQLPQ